jgi:16S rRNA pseudouridine516 synthase
MTISHQRLDRYISKQCSLNRKAVKLMLAQQRVKVDGIIAGNADQIINKFSKVELDNQTLQDNAPVYVMLHKPVGVESSTLSDKQDECLFETRPANNPAHTSVIDLLEREDRHTLHIVGRLDLNTSGLILLTNDSRWSKRLTSPEHKIQKHYRVTLGNKLTPAYSLAFEQGMYFSTENITTRPAKLEILSDYIAEVKLIEGRYHQIKRMFGRFRNPVVALHRQAIGQLVLDDSLKPGESRELTEQEVALACKP